MPSMWQFDELELDTVLEKLLDCQLRFRLFWAPCVCARCEPVERGGGVLNDETG